MRISSPASSGTRVHPAPSVAGLNQMAVSRLGHHHADTKSSVPKPGLFICVRRSDLAELLIPTHSPSSMFEHRWVSVHQGYDVERALLTGRMPLAQARTDSPSAPIGLCDGGRARSQT